VRLVQYTCIVCIADFVAIDVAVNGGLPFRINVSEFGLHLAYSLYHVSVPIEKNSQSFFFSLVSLHVRMKVLVGLVFALRPQTPKHNRGGWSHYTDTNEPVDEGIQL
jgi:hypothetical protein